MIKIRYFINGGLFISFLAMALTGLIKFPGFLGKFGLTYVFSSISTLNSVHHWSGAIFMLFVLWHLADNRQWLLFSKTWRRIIILIILLVAVALAAIFFLRGPSAGIKQLQDVEIKQYQGEDLSSVVDLQDVSISGTQNIDIDNYNLKISGLVENPKQYTYEDIIAFPNYSKVVTLNCVVGWSAKILWQGVLVKDLLAQAGVESGAKIAIFYAQDGFTSSLPLDFINDNNIILAYKVNGIVLPAEKGFPFQLVAEQKWGYKWVKWLTEIEVSDNVNYKGTYESSGYSNDASIEGPIHQK